MLGLCQLIDAHDPLLEVLRPYLAALRDATGETVVLGKRQELSTIYLDTMEASQAIRYIATVGQLRPLYANSIGKALLSVMPKDDLMKVVDEFTYTAITNKTISSTAALLNELDETRKRGWASNISETFADLAAIAMPIHLNDEWYGVSVVGPLLRMQASWHAHIAALKHCVGEMQAAITTDMQ